MLKHLEDKRSCPRCGHEYHEQPYLMARSAEENVLPVWLPIYTAAVVLLALIIQNA